MEVPEDATLVASVVIAARDAASTIDRQLAALAAQSPPFAFEVLVADNGSLDDTAARVEAWGDRLRHLRVLDASEVSGAGFARNVGAAAAIGEVLAFCDADDAVDPGWLAAIVPAAQRNGLATGPIQLLGSDGRELGRADALHVPFGFLPTAPTANLAVRRSLFEAIGGFTTAFAKAGGEDADLCWRAQLDAGAELVFEPAASICYHVRENRRERLKRVWHYEQCNTRLYVMYRERGMRREPVRVLATRAYSIVRHPWVVARSEARRDRALRWVVMHASRAAASVRYRVVFP